MQQNISDGQQKFISFGRLFSDASQLFGQAFKKLVLIYIFTFVPALLIFILDLFNKGNHLVLNIAELVLFTISLLLILVGQMAVMFAIRSGNQNISAWQAFKLAAKKIHSAILIFLLVFGVIALWSIIIGLFLFTPYFLMHVYAGVYPTNLTVRFLEIIFAAAFVALTVYLPIRLGIRYFFSTFLLVDQNLRGTKALAASFNYSKGVTLKLFWRLLALLFVYIVCSVIISFIFGSLLPVSVVTSIIITLLHGILSVFVTVYCYVLYAALRDYKGLAEPMFTPAKRARVITSAIFGLLFTAVVWAGLPTITYFFLYAEVSNIGVVSIPAK